MINGEVQVLQPWDDDEMHASTVEEFCRTETFDSLPVEIKKAIWAHGEEHVKRLAEKIAKGQAGPAGGAPGVPGAPGQPQGAEAPGKPAPAPITTPQGPIV